MMLFQASCVAINGRALMIEGPPGSGKSSLALALIDRGAILVGDDGVELALSDGRLIASPPPNIEGKLEIRNVGIVDFPTCSAPVALLLTLSPDAPRYVDCAETTTLLDQAIPKLEFTARDYASAIRAEYALAKHGLQLGNNHG